MLYQEKKRGNSKDVFLIILFHVTGNTNKTLVEKVIRGRGREEEKVFHSFKLNYTRRT